MSEATSISERVQGIRARIDAAAKRSDRSPQDVTLLGASKFQSAELVFEALQAGVTCLGENYVQEAAEKQAALDILLENTDPGVAPPRWHMIGALQRNKAKAAVALFDVIETVDRASLAKEIDKRARVQEKIVDVFIQVNLSGESQKAGIDEAGLPELLETCAGLENIRATGLMTIPAPVDDPAHNRPAFAQLRTLRDTFMSAPGGELLDALSMGMSRDFEIAIEEGATVVRVGTELFGPRPPKP